MVRKNIVPKVQPPPTTLSAVMQGDLFPFEVEGETFQMRQPTTEEYDDALNLQRLVYRQALAQPHIAALKEYPCTDAERANYERLLERIEADQEAAADDQAKRDELEAEKLGLLADLETRTLAEETASEQAILKRDRWLTARLLCDAEGNPVFQPNSKDFATQWERLSLKVKDTARPAVWIVLGMVREAPFSWATLRAPS
jgi:hypothetical protein